MTPASDIRDHALDAIAHNLNQDRLIANPSTEVDSLVEHLAVLNRTSLPEQRPHIAAIVTIVKGLLNSNRLELGCTQHIAGTADELQVRGVKPLAKKAVARELRDPLANLLRSKLIGPTRVQQAMDIVADVCSRSSRANVLSVAVRHEIGVKRYSLLTELVAAMPAEAFA